MNSEMKRVVITGMGVISPVGNDVNTFWESLKTGKCGISRLEGFEEYNLPIHVAGRVKDFDPIQSGLSAAEKRRNDIYSQYALAAAAQAKADFDNAKTYYNRMKKAGKKAVSASELDQAKAQFLAADAALQQAEAEQQKADVLYNYTVLQAPISGIVGDVTLTKGDYVAPGGTSLFSIIQFDPIRVKFAISDKEYLSAAARAGGGKLFAGEDIQIRLADGRIYPADGVFRYTDNQVDKSTNSVTVFADFANTDKQLLANSYVDVLLSKQMKDIFLVRQNYATLNDKGAFVYVMQKGNLKQVPLKIAGYLDDYYITENKFAQDEYLVVDKIGRIAPGTKLKMSVAPAETEEK